MREYIYHPTIELDIKVLTEIAERRKNIMVPNMHRHHRLVADEPYLVEIQKQIPILAGIYNLYNMKESLKPHIDRDRYASFNIPIRGCENTTTTIYESVGKSLHNFEYTYLFSEYIGEIRPVFSYTMNRVTVLNTKTIHDVRFDSNHVGDRLSISWSFMPNITYSDAVDYFESMRMLKMG